MQRQTLTEKIEEAAIEIGFDSIGFTSSNSFESTEKIIIDRIDKNLLSGLPWFTKKRAKRGSNPKEILPEAKSIISLSLSYYNPKITGLNKKPTGKIAMYAWGEDYHRIFKRKMKDFISNIEKIVGKPIKTHWYTDTGPMSDRAVAQRSGLGWFGKNTNLLTPTGSWVVLGQIITDIDLESSDQSKKSCGNCTLCIDACPTNAIIGPGILDNNKCISYQTIENKGPIPLNLRKQIGNWIFGCDICQDVCPVNRKSQLGAAYNEFSQPDENRINPELLEILGMSNEDFKKRFAKSPVLRAKINGMKRNVCVALGNIKDPSTVQGLSSALDTEEPIVRGHAAWALGEIGGEEALTALIIHRGKEKDNYVIEEINGALDRQIGKG